MYKNTKLYPLQASLNFDLFERNLFHTRGSLYFIDCFITLILVSLQYLRKRFD